MRRFPNSAVRGAVALILPGLILGGCVSTPKLQPRLADIEMLDRALLVTEGVEIEVLDADGPMPKRIRPEEPFMPGRHVPAIVRAGRLSTDPDKTTGRFSSSYGYSYFHEPGAYYGIATTYYGGTDSVFASMLPPGNVRGFFWKDTAVVRWVIPGSPADRAGLGEGGGAYIWDHEPRVDVSAIDRPAGERLSYTTCRSSPDDCESVRRTIEAEERARPYRVRVHVADREQPLYGLLAFFPVYSTAEGSASRLHRIEIPERYIDRAVAGSVSLVYQPYRARYRGHRSGEIDERSAVSWALWMSDIPFYE